MLFGTLADDLGSFPFDYETYLSQSVSYVNRNGIRSLNGFGNPVRPLAQSELYPH